MKQYSTARIVNLVVFFLLLAGFGFLGIWFGFVVTPYMIPGAGAAIDLPDVSVALSWELGAFGLAAGIVSLVGFISSVLSMVKPDDKYVRFGFDCYVGVGFIVAAFLFLNAAWLYRLTTTNFGFTDLAFAVVFFVILSLVAIILSNVPFVRLHGDDINQNSQMRLLSLVLFAACLGVALPIFSAHMVMVGSDYAATHASSAPLFQKIVWYWVLPLCAAAASAVAFYGYHRGLKTNTVKNLNGWLFEGSLAIAGASFIVAGVFCYLQQEESVSFLTQEFGRVYDGMDFPVMSWIIGSLIALFAIILVLNSLLGKKNAKVAR